MAVIVLASPKGGAGKTTTAILLATELAHSGKEVVVLDCDPNHCVDLWARGTQRPPPDRVRVVTDNIEEDTIISTIKRHNRYGRFLIVDLEGVVSMLMSRAISQADLVLTPMRATVVDAQIGAKIIPLIATAKDVFGRAIKHAVVFTMTRGVITNQHRGLKISLEEQGVKVINPPLMERSAYSAVFTFGGDLRSMPPQGNMDRAIKNAELFAKAVCDLLEQEVHRG